MIFLRNPKSIVCFLKELYYKIRYQTNISGHDFIEDGNQRLICTRCGYEDKKFIFTRIANNAIKCYYCGEIFYVKEYEICNIKHKCGVNNE